MMKTRNKENWMWSVESEKLLVKTNIKWTLLWKDYECGILEWETSIGADQISIDEAKNPTKEASTLVTTSSNENLDQARNSELKSWIKHQVYTQVLDQDQPKICMRWVYTNKESNSKQTIKARLIIKSFQDKDVENSRNNSPTCSIESLWVI